MQMKYFTLALILLGLHACSRNPEPVPPAQTPAQHELAEHHVSEPPPGSFLQGDGTWAMPVPPVTPSPHIEFIEPPRTSTWSLHTNGREIVSVHADGRIFLHGKEVHTDAQYRAAIKGILLGAMGCTNQKQLEDATHVEE